MGLGTNGAMNSVLCASVYVSDAIVGVKAFARSISSHIRVFLAIGAFRFAAFQAALSAECQVFFLVIRAYCGSCLEAHIAWFTASLVFAESGYVFADLLYVFGFQDSAVRADKKTEFASHDAGFDIFDAV